MKKLLLLAMAMVFAFGAMAQTAEQIKESADRIAKLAELIKKSPSTCDIASLDGIVADLNAMANNSTEISKNLTALHAKPEHTAITALTAKIKKQAEKIKGVTEKLKTAPSEIKSAGFKAKLSGAKSLGFAEKALVIIGKETAYQGNAIAEIAKSLKK